MSKPVVDIKHLSKVYNIGHEDNVDKNSFKETVTRTLKKPTELLTGHKIRQEKFWALKSISAEIQRGDVVGLIGRNGSGKSTLLKMLSRIVEPSEGEIILRGNTASLLEVGTGFHPELTGRENIYFNGSILGMSHKEIETKFDEIVAFSEIERFLDTPVKFYSSGMYVRLAFAVAAHLEPDILIVDEVLAVGDASFQRKSLGKMRDVTRSRERTVIFVSHNMSAIQSICNKCIWLQSGEIKAFGETESVIKKYQETALVSGPSLSERTDRSGSGKARFKSLAIDDSKIRERQLSMRINLSSQQKSKIENALVSVTLNSPTGQTITNMVNAITNDTINITGGQSTVELVINNVNLVPGTYYLNLFLASDAHNSEVFDWVQDVAVITIPDYDYYKAGHPPYTKGEVIYLDYKFKNV